MPTPYCNGARWNAECIAAAGASAGFGRDRATLERLVAVSLAESGGKIDTVNKNTNGTVDVGLMQVNSIHGHSIADMKIPSKNMAASWEISNGGKNWRPWVAFKTGAYLLHLPTAKAGVSKLVSKGYKFGQTPTLTGGNEPNDNPLIPDEVEKLGSDIANVAEFPAKVLAWISDRNNIFRLIKAGLGSALVIAGITILAKPVFKPVADAAIGLVGSAGPGKVAKAAAKVG